MADVFDAQVKLAFVIPQAEVDKIKKVVSTAFAFAGGKSTAVGAMIGGKMGGAAGLAGMLTVASPSLMNSINRVTSAVMMILRPLGDIIAIGLRPIVDILKPIGMFFRILMKPYLQKAMEAMRLGRQFAAKGELGKAAESYALGAGFLLKPFGDMMIVTMTAALQGITWIIKELGAALLDALPGVSDEKVQEFRDTMDGLTVKIGDTGAKIIMDTNKTMTDILDNLKVDWELIKNNANVSMSNVNATIGEAFVDIINTTTNFFAPTLRDSTDKMFDDLKKTYREGTQAIVNEARSVFSGGGGGGGGGGSSSAGGGFSSEWARAVDLANRVGVSSGLAAKMNEISANMSRSSGGGGSSGAG